MNDEWRRVPELRSPDQHRHEIDNSREDGCSVVRLEVADQHLNSYGIAHGGIVATLLDTAAGQTACAFLDRERAIPVLTISLNISYLAPCKPGPVCCIGRVLGGGRTSVLGPFP